MEFTCINYMHIDIFILYPYFTVEKIKAYEQAYEAGW